MLFWKKEKRGFEIMNERNRQYIEKMDRENADKSAADKSAAEKAAAAAGEEANQTDNKEELSAWESADEREIAIEEARKQAEAFHKENQKMDLEIMKMKIKNMNKKRKIQIIIIEIKKIKKEKKSKMIKFFVLLI